MFILFFHYNYAETYYNFYSGDYGKGYKTVPRNRIKEFRESRCLTQEELGLLTSMDQTIVSKHEIGKLELTARDIEKYCRVFKIKPWELWIPRKDINEGDYAGA